MSIDYNIKIVIAIAVVLLFTKTILVGNGKYPIQNFVPTDYKAGIQNIDFAQNRDMNLFVANNLGVLSYNGIDWEVHQFETGKKQRSLAFDSESNRLYVGSQGEFGYFEKDWEYISLVELVPESSKNFDEVWDVFVNNKEIYFCTFRAIYVYDGEEIKVVSREGGLERSFLVNNRLFTQDVKGNIFEILNGELLGFNTRNERRGVVAGMIEHLDGYILFSNAGSVDLVSLGGEALKNQKLTDLLKDSYVNHVLRLSDSRIVISTQTSGLVIYDLLNENYEMISIAEGLQSNACLRTFQDHAGNLWVGMQNGIALIDINSPMRLINQDIGIQGSGYYTYETEKGTYFATSNGVYLLPKDSKQCVFLQGTEGPAYEIQEISGNLYVGHHTGLFKLEDRVAKKIANTNGLWSIQKLKSNPEYVVAGTYSGLLIFQDSEEGLVFEQAISGFEESSRFFEQDKEGNIWVGQYYKGLYKLKLSEDLSIAEVNKVSNERGLPIAERIILTSIDNDLFLGTNKGIYKLDQNQGEIIVADEFYRDIGNQPIYLIKQDQQRNIHVVAKNKVGYFKPVSQGNYVFVPSSLYQLRYSLNNDLLNVSINNRGEVFYSANEGFIRYDAALESRISSPKPIVIKRIRSFPQQKNIYLQMPFEARLENTDKVVIDRHTKGVEFEIESYDFNDVNNQQFSYQLAGFDDGYGIPTSNTIKEYTNLKQGSYNFTVKSNNYLGESTVSQPIGLQVKPPLHKTLGAKILYLLTGALSLIAVARIQKRRYESKQKILVHQKQDEINQKQKKLAEIEDLKEKELQEIREEKREDEIQHMNNLLAASTMNLVVKNDFITTIREEIEEVKLKGKNTETKKALEKILREIDTTLKVQEDWEQFEHHFDQVHGNFLTRLRSEFADLTPSEQKLSAFLRLNLNTKEIANLMSISVRGVEVSRYRLRKKLGLLKGVNLSKYILEY